MPYKDQILQKAAQHKSYLKNKEKVIQRSLQTRTKRRDIIRKIKESKPCTDCKKRFPYYIMDFDHLGDKVLGISKLITYGKWIDVLDEIKKCELVCANCHRTRTILRLRKQSPVAQQVDASVC